MKTGTLRRAAVSDAEALLRIYAQYIDTPVTFETELPSASEFAQRISGITAFYPYLVCERDGGIAGYAYAHRFRERPAYRWGAELSVYVDQRFQRNGIGRELYSAVIELLRRQNMKTVYGCVTLPNAGSEALHRSLGFQAAGIFHSAGFKCGKWHDVAWYEKQLGAYESAPAETLPCCAVFTAGDRPFP